MYIENKSAQQAGQSGIQGPARIGLVTFSKTGRTIYYRGKRLRNLNGQGYKTTHYDVDTGDEYWISGPRRDGHDGLYGYRPTPIDEDIREEYWIKIRRRPSRKTQNFS
jgi:hypothetical protein